MKLALILATITVVSAHSQSLDFQATCAAQSRKAFQEYEYEFTNGPGGKHFRTISSNYQSHYNTKLKKCMALIESTRMLANQSSTSLILTDAFERRDYAYYLWVSREGKKYWEVPPSQCELIPSLREKKNCTTREEFDAFVAGYMEE